MILRGLKCSRCIVSVSTATRDDVARLVGTEPERLHVVLNALDAEFIQEAHDTSAEAPSAVPGSPTQRLTQLPPGSRYLMHIGGDKWYKNRQSVLRIFARMAADDTKLQLVIVGPPFRAEQLAVAGCTPYRHRIHALSNLSDGTLRSVYRSAALLLFPSWIEGFGWPILEAQACGCPVVTLDRAPMNALNALPELILQEPVGGDPDAWHATAAERCANFLKHGDATDRRRRRARVKAFAADYTNEAAIASYLKIYTALWEREEA